MTNSGLNVEFKSRLGGRNFGGKLISKDKIDFKIDNLKSQHKKINSVKKDSFRKVLKHCYNFITMNSENGKTECVFEIPLILDSCPPIDANECANYLGIKLNKKGFKYYFHTQTRCMYISWTHLI